MTIQQWMMRGDVISVPACFVVCFSLVKLFQVFVFRERGSTAIIALIATMLHFWLWPQALGVELAISDPQDFYRGTEFFAQLARMFPLGWALEAIFLEGFAAPAVLVLGLLWLAWAVDHPQRRPWTDWMAVVALQLAGALLIYINYPSLADALDGHMP